MVAPRTPRAAPAVRPRPDARRRAGGRLDAHVRELLASTDEHLASRTAWRSLARGRSAPRSLVALGEELLPPNAARAPLHDQQRIAWAMALSDLARAIAREFPENLFADLDHVAGELRRIVAEQGVVALERTIDPLVRIHRTYGKSSPIRFRYVHDFLYGFDWARWVAREPSSRRNVRPYDATFLAHIERRALELGALIQNRDPTYPPLPPGAFRNPFPFDREPPSEERLFRALAEEDLLPLRAFDADAPLAPAARSFSTMREARAGELGLRPGG
ncbi:MAG: hypothetical protein ACK6CU_01080 [Deltaproteobacteria bacterium]|jgi:hypothetical protein